MNVSERLAASAVVPVVVLDDAKDAVATAKALLAGGVDVMEITFRTAAAADTITAVGPSAPPMMPMEGSSLCGLPCFGLFGLLCVGRARLLGHNDGRDPVDGRAEGVEFFLIAGHDADRAVRVKIYVVKETIKKKDLHLRQDPG